MYLQYELTQFEPRYQALAQAERFSPEWMEWAKLQARVAQLRYDFNQLLDLPTALTDLRLYAVHWQRILSTSLYFLEIKHREERCTKLV